MYCLLNSESSDIDKSAIEGGVDLGLVWLELLGITFLVGLFNSSELCTSLVCTLGLFEKLKMTTIKPNKNKKPAIRFQLFMLSPSLDAYTVGFVTLAAINIAATTAKLAAKYKLAGISKASAKRPVAIAPMAYPKSLQNL